MNSTDRGSSNPAPDVAPNAPSLMHSLTLRVLSLVFVAGILAWQTASILGQTDGTLYYSLDDPYIHLSLAENILRGHYGINLDEYASPSSSILYPVLVAGGLGLGLGDLAPFALNVLAMLGIAWILGGLLARLRPRLEPAILVALPFALLAVNAAALPFSGMEHTLHMWSSLLIASGLIRLVETGRASVWLVIGIVLSPLLRFEGFALAACAIIVLFVWRQPRPALVSLAILVAATGAYVALMTRLGLPPLPSSVMVKSATSTSALDAAAIPFIVSLLNSVRAAVSSIYGVALIFGCSFIVLALGIKDRQSGQRTIGLAVLVAIIAHILLANFSGYPRYEAYIIGTLYVTGFWLYAPELRRGNRMTGLGIATFCASLSLLYLAPLIYTPEAAQNIRDQQWQMHRFATEFFPERVAVNDLGWVSYQNDQYVLDLWGLGSEEARLIAAEGRTPEIMYDLAARNDVTYAMVYDEWFEGVIPPQWCRIAQFETIQVTAASDIVAFYLIDVSRETDMRSAIQDFTAELLPETSIETYDCP